MGITITRPKNIIPTEHQEQSAVIAWWDKTYPMDKADLFAVPNGAWLAGNEAQRNQQMSKLKREGVREGIPDLFLAVPNAIYHGLFIEMKRLKGGVLSPIQKRRIAKFKTRGYAAHVCEGAEMAIEIIKKYMSEI